MKEYSPNVIKLLMEFLQKVEEENVFSMKKLVKNQIMLNIMLIYLSI